MKIEKKLIAYSVIALMIGVASIVPMLFLMSAKAETTSKPWFSINIPYAYLTTNASEKRGDFVVGTFGFWHSTLINITVNADAWNDLVDVRFEYFQIQAYSDVGPIWNQTYFVGANRTYSSGPLDWFNSFVSLCINTSSTGTLIQRSNDSALHMGLNSGGWSSNMMTQEFSDIKKANVVYIDISRMGYATFGGNSTLVKMANNEIIQHIELKKIGDGFLYNTLVPEDQLSQDNLLSPPVPSLNHQKP